MNLPPGWQTQLGRNGAVLAHSGDNASWIVIAPIPNNGNLPAADWLKRNGPASVGAYLRNASLTGVYPSRTSRTSAMAKLDFATPAGPGTALLLCFMAGPVGTIYVIGGPSASFAQQRSQLIRSLQSFSFTGERVPGTRRGEGDTGGDGAAPDVRYTRFQDPREGAFSIDVPAGWRVEGGMVRKSSVDTRAYLRALSPDGTLLIGFGDPEIGSFTEPTQILAMSGLREGMPYSPGYGTVMMIRRFVPGSNFAQEYASRVARDMQCASLQFKSVKPLPQYSARTNIGPAIQTTMAGEANFTCTRGGQEFAGTVWAQTSTTHIPGTEGTGSIWTVPILISFLAPESKAATAAAMIKHMIPTFQMSGAWFNQQQQTTARTSQIVKETGDYTSKIITDSYWARQRSQERTNRQFDDYIRGTVRLRDPESGEELEGVSGKNYYYRVPGTNNTVGTDATDFQNRNPDFTELEQVR
jgi:hypothetical protein